MDQARLKEIHDSLIAVAHKAGEMILNARPSTQSAGSKKNSVDLVTETDKAVEKFISTELSRQYPEYAFIGEETYIPGQTNLTASPTFIVDPIDGTTNFVHAYPYVAISLGFSIDFTAMIGVVYNPFTGQLYTAIKSQGAYLTTTFPGRPTQEPRTVEKLPLRTLEGLTGLKNAQLAVEWGSDRRGNDMDVKARTFTNLIHAEGAMVHSLRSFGSAALNLCSVASGSLDAYWEAGCWSWDVCAGWCILEESGGVMVGANRGEWKAGLETRRYFAVRGEGDGHGESEEVDGVRVRKGQKAFVEELWKYVEGDFQVGK